MKWLCIAALVFAGCEGSIGTPGAGLGSGTGGGTTSATGGGEGGSGGGYATTATPFVCKSDEVVNAQPLKRLSQIEFTNSLTDLVRAAMPTSGTAVLGVVQPLIAKYPTDRLVGPGSERHGGFFRLDQIVQQSHVDAAYDVAVALGKEVTSSAARRTDLFGACATDASTANDAQCLTDFVTRFGALALRHPLEPADVDFYKSIAATTPVDPAALADVVALLLSAPGFLYHVESGTTAVQGDVYALDGYELAARLSFHFWQTSPDAALLAAAKSGDLLTEAGYQAQAKRLFDDPRSDAAMDEFFAQWFRLDELGPLDARIGDPVFDAFAGATVPTSALRKRMTDEILDLARHVARSGAPLSEVLTSRKAMAKTDDLAALYGDAKWVSGAPVDQSQPSRSGLITRAAFLATGSASTRPVMKGFRIRNALMCEPIPPPPANAAATPPELAPDLTTREVVEKLTQQTGTSCAGCHTTLLNPTGFATENFDSLGRARTSQTLFNAAGAVVATRPIDTTSVPRIINTDLTASTGAADVTRLIAQSGKFETCFSKQYFRFAFGREEDAVKDGCVLKAIDEAARGGTSLGDLWMHAALQPEFKRRRIP